MNLHYLTSTKLLNDVTLADTPSPFYEQCSLPLSILLPIKQLRVYLPSHNPVISHFQAVLHPEISHFQRLFNAKISHFQPLTDCKVSAKKRHLQALAAFSCVFSRDLTEINKLQHIAIHYCMYSKKRPTDSNRLLYKTFFKSKYITRVRCPASFVVRNLKPCFS